MFCLIIAIIFPTIDSLTNQITSWTQSSPIPFPVHSQASGYDPYTGIVHFMSGSHYYTYDTLTDIISPLQSIPNNGQIPDQSHSQFDIQINRMIYIYNDNNHCLDTFNMETSTFTSCWSSIATIIPIDTLSSCLAIDDTARYFYIISETNSFFFYDTVESTWYLGPNTVLQTHISSGCDVVDNKLFYWGGHSAIDGAITSLSYIDISDMNTLKSNPLSFQWSIQYNFLPFAHEFVRNIAFDDGTVYSVGAEGNYTKTLVIDLITNEVHESIDIETHVIGGSLIWDSCKYRFYYFGRYLYVSNVISGALLPSKYGIECINDKTNDWDLMWVTLLGVIIVIAVCISSVVLFRSSRGKYGFKTEEDDKNASLSELDYVPKTNKDCDFALPKETFIKTNLSTSAPKLDDEKNGVEVTDISDSWRSKSMSSWSKEDVLCWLAVLSASDISFESVIKCASNGTFCGSHIVGLKSKNDVEKLFGIDNSSLSNRIWQEINELNTHASTNYIEGNDLWNSRMMGQKVQLQSDLKTLIVEKEFIWTTACMKRQVSTGVHCWTFELQEYHGERGVNGWSLLIGIWKKDEINRERIDYFFCSEPNTGYAFVASDGVLIDPLKGAVSGKKYGVVVEEHNTPYLIQMIVDLDKKTVSYVINHKYYGIAFRDIDDNTYVAAISFMPHLGRQKLKFISYKTKLQIN